MGLLYGVYIWCRLTTATSPVPVQLCKLKHRAGPRAVASNRGIAGAAGAWQADCWLPAATGYEPPPLGSWPQLQAPAGHGTAAASPVLRM